MNPFGKKPPPVTPAWHPDFRDAEALPDVKVIRTSFYVNGISVLVLLIVAIFLAFQEFGRHSLKAEIGELEAKIAANSSRNQEVLGLHRAFQAEERLIKEVADYLRASLELSGLLVVLGDTLEPGIMFDGIRYQDVAERGRANEKELAIVGSIEATPDAAASAIAEYLNVFQREPFLARRVKEAVPTSLVPTPAGDKMSFGIRLTLKIPDEEKKSKEEETIE